MIRILIAWIAATIAGVLAGGALLAWFDQQSFLAAAGPAATLPIGERLAWFGRTLYGLVVIDDVDALFRHGFVPTGSVNRNTLPPPGLGCTHRRPSWYSTMERQMFRPMPMPSLLVV